jgi:hypothetical protein
MKYDISKLQFVEIYEFGRIETLKEPMQTEVEVLLLWSSAPARLFPPLSLKLPARNRAFSCVHERRQPSDKNSRGLKNNNKKESHDAE